MTDIRMEREKLREQGLVIRTREEWDAVQDYTSDRACDVPAVAFFLHIAVVDDPSDLLGTEDQVARNIEGIGQSRFGSGMSYNALAFNTGRLYEGQPLTRRGTHTVNTFERAHCPTHSGSLEAPAWTNNINARALCLPQQVDDPVTDVQIDTAARWAAAQIRSGLAAPWARWHGHRCVTAKDCPGGRAFDRIPELQALTEHYAKHGLEDDMTPEDLMKHRIEVDRDGKEVTISVEQLLRETFQRAERVDIPAIVKAVVAAIPATTMAASLTLEQIETAVEVGVLKALRKGTG